MTICDLQPGQHACVVSVGSEGVLKRRIFEMGITPGVKLTMIKVAPLGDPIEIELRGYHLSLRKTEAAQIEIK